jgi:hypothetical protein
MTTKRGTTDFKMPTKKDGTKDKRYSVPQFLKKDGTMDRRTTPTKKRT